VAFGVNRVSSTVVFGGAGRPIQQDVEMLSIMRPDILIGTPGRILDLILKVCVAVSSVNILVLDEADKLITKEFVPQLVGLADRLPHFPARQTILVSATFTDRHLTDFALKYMDPNFTFVAVGEQGKNQLLDRQVQIVHLPGLFCLLGCWDGSSSA